MVRTLSATAIALTLLVLAGCGSGSRHATATTVTVARYGPYPADTIAVPAGAASGRVCRTDAQAYADGAKHYVEHFGPAAATPADTSYMLLREQLADFDAHGCAMEVLARRLVAELRPRERRALVANLPPGTARRVRAALHRFPRAQGGTHGR